MKGVFLVGSSSSVRSRRNVSDLVYLTARHG